MDQRLSIVSLSGLLLVALLAVGPARAAAPEAPAQSQPEASAPQGDQFALLVRQLGDPSSERRSAASQRLTEIGLAARDRLLEGLQDSDPEVRRRCRWILADVLDTDHRRRLEAFVADSNPDDDHGLPGWSRYRQIVGHDKPARELFVEMHRTDGGLLASAAIGPGPAVESLTVRFQQVYRLMVNRDPTRRVSPRLGTVAALIFVWTDPALQLPNDLTNSSYLRNMIQQQEFQKALREGPFKPAARKLLGQWILRPAHTHLLSSNLQLAIQHDLKEGLYLSVQTLKQKNKPQGYMLGYAVSGIGVLGGKPHAARLAGLLDDETECTRFVVNNVKNSIQVRDVALAWLIYLTGQKHEEFGMDQAKREFERKSSSGRRHINFGSFRFTKPEQRDKALAKFKAWLKDHPLPEPPEVPASTHGAPAQAAAPQAVAGGANPAAAPQAADRDEQPIPAPMALAPAPRLQVRALSDARQLTAVGRYADAAARLGRILAAEADFSFQPSLSVPLYRCLKPEAERLLAEMPEAVREAYRSLYQDRAQALLDEAVRTGDAAGLGEVSARYFHTRAGAEATYLLALHHFDHARPLRAALYFDRLRHRSLESAAYEPGLSLMLAVCWTRTGMPEAAQSALARVGATRGGGAIEVAGRPRSLFANADQALGWLESLVGPSPEPQTAGGWPMFRGGPSRNVASDIDCPFLNTEPSVPLSSEPLVHQTADKLRKADREQFRTILPRLHPLVVGDSVVIRRATEMQAIDPGSGEPRWTAPLEDPLRYFLKHADGEEKAAQADDFADGLKRRLWRDTCFGTLSSDGQFVFGVEDLDFGFRADYQQTVVGPDGRRRLDPNGHKDYNLLVAYDLKTGKAHWEVGGPPDIETAPLAGAYFLGAPLPLGGRLYVVADVDRETRILELNPSTGQPTWQLTLSVREKDPRTSAFRFMPLGLTATAASRRTASPSYADGVLVCRTSDDQFVGVDLTTRSVQWIYQTTEPDMDLGSALANPWARRIQQDLEARRNDDWADASVTIAQRRILLTPPRSGKLLCLDLADGHLLWSAPRRDGLMVACVHDGRVVVAGRGSLWAVKLSDGTPAWPEPTLRLPADALLSGRGLLSGDRYYLPLTTAEVAVVDLVAGRFVSRSRSPDGIVPGNLVACRGSILSQNADGLRQFPTLAQRQRETAEALAQRPDDAKALADHGEALLCQGRLIEAVDHLRRALKAGSSPRTKRLLIDALEDGLQADFATFRELAVQLDPVLDDPDVRWRFLRQLALAHQKTGEHRAAFETYLRLAEMPSDREALEHTTSTRLVRRDRWTAARLEELYKAVDAGDRAEMDRLILQRTGDDRLSEMLTYFPFHPTANEARLRLAEQSLQRKEPARAECLLREVFETGDPLERRTAIARLADLLRRSGRPEDAARAYEYLGGTLADKVCVDGRTGQQLVDALPANDPVRQAMAAEFSWPEGKVAVEVVSKHVGVSNRYPLAVTGNDGPFDRPLSVRIDSGGQSLQVSDQFGRQLCEAKPEQKQRRWGFSSVLLSYSHGHFLGHTLVAWLGNRVCAVDTLGTSAKVLWVQETVTEDPPIPGMAAFMPWRMQMLRRPKPAGGYGFRSLVATPRGVYFQQDHKLVAVDPHTGKILFSRSDVDENCDLFGDEEVLFVTSNGSEEAAVYSAVDGRQLGWRQVPDLDQRLAVWGRRLLTWQPGDGGPRLSLVDPWTGQVAWQRTFAPQALPWMIDQHEVAVLDRAGRLTILRVPDGRPVVETQLKAQPKLEEAIVLRNGPRYLVIANRPLEQAGLIMVRQNVPGNVTVNGTVWGVDRATGKELWSTEIASQATRADLATGLPLLVCCNRLQKRDGNRIKSSQKTLLLDTRNGRVLHDKTRDGSSSNQMDLSCDPAKAQIEVRTYRETIKLTYAKKAAAK